VTRRRLRRSDLAALTLVLLALALAACGGGENDGEEVTAATEQPVAEETAALSADDAGAGEEPGAAGNSAESADDAADEPGPVPSAYARRVIPKVLLRLYVQTGEDLSLDWWVIAAVDQIDLNEGNPNIPPRERIPGIGYSLAAAGAPYDNRAALAARAGGAYADRCLKLAGRYVDTVAEQREDAEGDAETAG
jgi:hypothetical protein